MKTHLRRAALDIWPEVPWGPSGCHLPWKQNSELWFREWRVLLTLRQVLSLLGEMESSRGYPQQMLCFRAKKCPQDLLDFTASSLEIGQSFLSFLQRGLWEGLLWQLISKLDSADQFLLKCLCDFQTSRGDNTEALRRDCKIRASCR